MAEADSTESKVIYVDVERLLFDLDNPRFPALSDQRDALHAFCDDNHAKKTVLLAESIAEMGLNPAELLIVTRGERKGQYVALEGNRRLAAMKLLSLPSRLPDSPLSKPFQARIRKSAQITDQELLRRIPCRLLPSREEANVWIALKHTGENDGVGVVQWNGEESARFRGGEAGLQLLDYVRAHGELSAEAQEGMKRFPVTNFDRLLGDPAFREALGISIERGTVLITHPVDEVLRALTKIIEDLSRRDVTVTMIKLKQDRADYLETIRDHLPSSAQLDSPIDLAGSKRQSQAERRTDPTHSPSAKVKNKPLTRDRKTVIPKSCVIPIYIAKINDVFKELRTLDADSFPNAASSLLRILIDTTTVEYVEKMRLDVPSNGRGQVELKPRISAVLDDYKNRSGQREICTVAKNTLLQTQGAIYIEQLNFQIHGRYSHPMADQLRLGWDMIEGWVKGVWTTLDAMASEP